MSDPREREIKGLERATEDIPSEDEHLVVFDEELKERVASSVRTKKEARETAPVESELKAPRLLGELGRDKIRVLMISRERNLFVDGSAAQKRMREYGTLFEELHIIVFTLHEFEFGGMQIAENVWAYPTNSTSRWRYGIDAYAIAKRELYFAGDFRADVISAQDPFDAGLTAYVIARRFTRAFQIQVHVDFYESTFKKQDEHNGIRQWMAWFLLPKADRIRVVSDHLKKKISKTHPNLKDRIDVLPVFTDLAGWRDSVPVFNLHERYPQFTFIILMASRLVKEKNIKFAIDVTKHMLRQYGTVGLVIVGSGPEEEKLKLKVKEEGLEEKIIFEPWQSDITSHMKTADMFLLTSTYEGYGQTLVEAAASGLPIVTTNVGIAPVLLEHDKSGMICEIGDLGCFVSSINKYLSNSGFRKLAARDAQERAFALIETNIGTYHRLFREGMERTLLSAMGKEVVTEPAENELQKDIAPTVGNSSQQ